MRVVDGVGANRVVASFALVSGLPDRRRTVADPVGGPSTPTQLSPALNTYRQIYRQNFRLEAIVAD